VLSLEEMQAIRLTVAVAATAVAVSLPVATLLGWLLSRPNWPGRGALEMVVHLPLVLPPVVTGYLLLVLFGRQGVLGGFFEEALGVRFVFDFKGVVLAACVVSLPLFVRPISLAFASIDPRYAQAARTLGAGPIDAFFTVMLPLARRGIVAGAILAFARGMGEFGATIMIAGSIPGRTQTIPLYIYNLLEAPGGMDRAQRMVWVSIGIAALALAAGGWLERRGRRERAETAA
jgi:molybdate transport system permease protein